MKQLQGFVRRAAALVLAALCCEALVCLPWRRTLAALAVLGYGPAEINLALKGLDLAALSLEDIVRQALKKMLK
mgnify:CR=1 FL=1